MLDTAIKVGVKEVAQRGASLFGGEVIESFSTAAAKAAKTTPTPKKVKPNFQNNGLFKHTEYKKNIRTQEAKQWVSDLPVEDVHSLEELRRLEPTQLERYYELVQNASDASADNSPYANELWTEVNGATFNLKGVLDELHARQQNFTVDDDLNYVKDLSPEQVSKGVEGEVVNRIAAQSKTKGEGGVSAAATAGTAESGVKSFGRKGFEEGEVSEFAMTALGDGVNTKIPNREQHHELIKAYFAPFIKKARELGSELEVVNLAYMADDYGFGLGDYLAAMKMMDRIPHSMGHKELLESGVQPGTIFRDWTLAGERTRIEQITDINVLTREFKKAIQEVGVPMRTQMNLWQDAWEMIPIDARVKLIQLHNARGDFPKGSKGYKEADKPYQALKKELTERLKAKKKEIELNEKQLKEFQSNEQVRRAMDATSPEDWTPQQRAIVASASGEVLGSNPELADFARRLREFKPGQPAPVTQVKHKIDMSDFIKRMEQMEVEQELARQEIRDKAKMVDVTPREPEPEGPTIDLNDLLNDRL